MIANNTQASVLNLQNTFENDIQLMDDYDNDITSVFIKHQELLDMYPDMEVDLDEWF